jgi:hypothetical protein
MEVNDKNKREPSEAHEHPGASRRAALATSVEEVLMRVRGVMAVTVEVDEKGEVRVVHVSADAGRDPKQLARDIESAVSSQLVHRLDYSRISISPVGLEPTSLEAERRRDAVDRILALQQRLRGRGISMSDLIAESRRELEGQSAARRR